MGILLPRSTTSGFYCAYVNDTGLRVTLQLLIIIITGGSFVPKIVYACYINTWQVSLSVVQGAHNLFCVASFKEMAIVSALCPTLPQYEDVLN